MTNTTLAKSYIQKARVRLKVLDLLLDNEAYSDVVREAQEVVELALKGMLRQVGIEPPKYHDVGPFLLDNRVRFSEEVSESLAKLAKVSGWLRKEREFSFYGDIDFIPTERYDRDDADRAIADAVFVVETASKIIR